MAGAREKELPSRNTFFRDRYQSILMGSFIAIVLILFFVMIVLYQVSHRPLSLFYGTAPNGQQIPLAAYDEPNLLSTTLTAWASKAAVAAYTFDFVNYNAQIQLARPYFTEAGWADYQLSVENLIQSITQNQLFVNGVVSGPPVISNQGDLPGQAYAWRVQIPFLVTYQSAENTTKKNFTVLITIVKVPTTQNPAGIGIDQFVMR